jgi:uncharacterized membrane protein
MLRESIVARNNGATRTGHLALTRVRVTARFVTVLSHRLNRGIRGVGVTVVACPPGVAARATPLVHCAV